MGRSGLGILLEREIRKSGLSLNEFARRAGVLPATVSRLVNGQQASAKRTTLERLAAFLGCEVRGLEMVSTPIHQDLASLPEVDSPPGVLQLVAIERAIDRDASIPPKRKKWLKQCVEFARNAP